MAAGGAILAGAHIQVMVMATGAAMVGEAMVGAEDMAGMADTGAVAGVGPTMAMEWDSAIRGLPSGTAMGSDTAWDTLGTATGWAMGTAILRPKHPTLQPTIQILPWPVLRSPHPNRQPLQNPRKRSIPKFGIIAPKAKVTTPQSNSVPPVGPKSRKHLKDSLKGIGICVMPQKAITLM